MKGKGLLGNRSTLSQLICLLLLMAIGAIVSTLLGTAIMGWTGHQPNEGMSNPSLLRMFQFVTSVGTFLLPAILTAWLIGPKLSQYLWLSHIPSGYAMLLTFVSVLLFTPVINLLGYFNEQIHLPGFLKSVEEWMVMEENAAQQITDTLLGDHSAVSITLNLFVIALTAAFSEEFFFRGTLSRIFLRFFPNHHVTIWSIAFIFSAIHLQFLGFFPRMILGAYLGYLVYWSKSLWLPILAHFINNAVAVIGMSNDQWKESELISGEIPAEQVSQYTLSALVFLIGFVLLTDILRKQLKKEQIKGGCQTS